jgi:type II secretory pathway component PulK
MRKHDEGYALPFVLVVFVVFSLIATSILTISLNNLKKQQASIQRTQDQYAAQGEIEKACVIISGLNRLDATSINTAMVNNAIKVTCDNNSSVPDNVILETNCGGTVEIQCVIKVDGGVVSYKSYEVITNGGGG